MDENYKKRVLNVTPPPYVSGERVLGVPKINRWVLLLFFLFLLPIAIGQIPFPNNELTEEAPAQKLVAYAAPIIAETVPDAEVLLLFTHSHEAYKPVAKVKTGVTAVYDEQVNIYSLQELIHHYLQLNGVKSSTLAVDVMKVMKQESAAFHEAYRVVRPYIQEELTKKDYELILDIHRDSAPASVTTLKAADGNYAKIAFVIGTEHPSYAWNLAYAEGLSAQLNAIVPGISRGVMKKEGAGVNGIYNQDLSPAMVLVELGGIDNTEEELQRTLAVLAQGIAKIFVSEQL